MVLHFGGASRLIIGENDNLGGIAQVSSMIRM